MKKYNELSSSQMRSIVGGLETFKVCPMIDVPLGYCSFGGNDYSRQFSCMIDDDCYKQFDGPGECIH